MPTKKPLVEHFKPISYSLEQIAGSADIKVVIEGRRVGRPSSRLTLHQKGLKIKSAKVIYRHKNKVIEYAVARINHLPSFQEVRLHSSQPLYPGEYQIQLVFSGSSFDEIKSQLKNDLTDVELRAHIPSIDEPEAKQEVLIDLK